MIDNNDDCITHSSSDTVAQKTSDKIDNKKNKKQRGNGEEVTVDMIVIMRGGGSFEDLMGFSDIRVIEAIHESKIYTLTAIGHEIDTMLCDYASNYRAPTPSVAGEVIASIDNKKWVKMNELIQTMNDQKNRMARILYKYKNALLLMEKKIVNPKNDLTNRLNSYVQGSHYHVLNNLKKYQKWANDLKVKIEKNNSTYMLNQGFALLTDLDGTIIYDITKKYGKEIKMINKEGTFKIKISRVNQKAVKN
jgi:exodeoxyribonuclease VII large subunit